MRSAEGFIRGSCDSNGIDIGLVEGMYFASTLLSLGIGNILVAFFALAVLVPRNALIVWVALVATLWYLKRSPEADA